MALIDLLLNLAGLIFWHAWRGSKIESPTGSALTLASNLRPAGVQRPRRWIHLVSLAVLLLLRPVFYWHLGAAVDWSAAWSPGLVHLLFRSDFLVRMVQYSFLSFFWTLFLWHSWLCWLSALNPRKDLNPVTQGVREQIGWLRYLPGPILVVVPFVILGLGWYFAAPLFTAIGVLPQARSHQQLVQQSLLIAASLVFRFRWLLSAVFLLRFLNTYVYLGTHPFWEFIQRSARILLWPFNWMRFAKFDFAPILGLVLVWWGSIEGEAFLRKLFFALPLAWP
jgi:hypothetical protein